MITSDPLENTLPKEERLSDKTSITRLVREGHYAKFPGMRYSFRDDNGLDINRIMVSVPKRYFKRAVKRNLLKRRIREAYRLQKGLVERKGVDIMFLYDQKEILNFTEIYNNIKRALTEINGNHVGQD